MEIEYGAQVLDKDNKVLGTVNYVVRDTYTGNVKTFKVDTELIQGDLFFSTEDVEEASPTRIVLKKSFAKPQ